MSAEQTGGPWSRPDDGNGVRADAGGALWAPVAAADGSVQVHAPAGRRAAPAWRRWTLAAVLAAALLVPWTVQYALWVPAVYAARAAVWLVRGALHLGLWAVLLLVVPVVGWLVLAVVLVGRHRDRQAERRHREQLAALGAPSAPEAAAIIGGLWRPWFGGAVATVWRGAA